MLDGYEKFHLSYLSNKKNQYSNCDQCTNERGYQKNNSNAKNGIETKLCPFQLADTTKKYLGNNNKNDNYYTEKNMEDFQNHKFLLHLDHENHKKRMKSYSHQKFNYGLV